MKTPRLLLSVLACAAVAGSYAQNIPTHDSYVRPFEEGKQKISRPISGIGILRPQCPKTRTSTSRVFL